MSRLINELLTLTRLEEIDRVQTLESVDLTSLVNEVCDSFGQVFIKKFVVPEFSVQENVVLNANADQLRRLISVLTENASKYVTENGEVKIALKADPRKAVFSIFNTCELGEDFDYKRLFDRFYRPDSSRTSSTGGHGIGLSIAKEITALHNGSIEAKPVEGGVIFTATISARLKQSKKK
ncbi:MAG: hypothetical protein IIU39_08540 [Ruminococcus sp.]|nr:hypothetical protein [Ruminococcus sp.]